MVAADLRAIYGAATLAEAEHALERFAALNQFVILCGERVPV